MATERTRETGDQLKQDVDDRRDDLEEKETALEHAVDDIQSVEQTLEKLHMEGTLQAAETIEAAVESAKDTARDTFQTEDEKLDTSQAEGGEEREDLEGRESDSQEDVEQLEESTGSVKAQEIRDHLDRARDASQADLELLSEQRQELETTLERSEQQQERLRQDAQL
ncbi:MAG: hypothetical protein WD534_15140 [Phycisphaeraceae bacterium]